MTIVHIVRRLRVFQVLSVYPHRPLIINLFPPPPLNGTAAIPQSRPAKLVRNSATKQIIS